MLRTIIINIFRSSVFMYPGHDSLSLRMLIMLLYIIMNIRMRADVIKKKTNMDRTVLLTTYSSPEEAAIVVGMLRSNGIPCEIENRNNLYVPIFNGVDIIVFEKDFERARKLIEQHQE